MATILSFLAQTRDVVHILNPFHLMEEAEHLQRLSVIAITDDLWFGPSHHDHQLHRLMREKYWQNRSRALRLKHHRDGKSFAGAISSALQLEDSIRLAIRSKKRIVVWGHRGNSLSVLWCMDALQSFRRDHFDITLVWIQRMRVQPDMVKTFELSGESVEKGAVLWRLFTDGSPGSFCDGCDELNDDVFSSREIARSLTSYFPQRRNGRLILSEFDEHVVGSVPLHEWVTMAAVRPSYIVAPGGNSWTIMERTQRILQWLSTSKGSPFMEADELKTGPNLFCRLRVRLTEAGAELLKGMNRIDQAPVFEVGAFKAYHPSDPWIVTANGRVEPYK